VNLNLININQIYHKWGLGVCWEACVDMMAFFALSTDYASNKQVWSLQTLDNICPNPDRSRPFFSPKNKKVNSNQSNYESQNYVVHVKEVGQT
jgi:hypothetical protein